MALLLLPLAALAALAAACDVCSGRSAFAEPSTNVDHGAGGDYARCACEFVFQYSAGETPGRVRVEAVAGMGPVVVYGSLDANAAPLAVLDADGATGPVVLTAFSMSGLLRVVLDTPAVVPADARVVLAATAINQAPTIVERDNLVFEPITGFETHLLVPHGVPDRLPVIVRDPDNNNRGLRADLFVLTDIGNVNTVGLTVPAVPGVDFLTGSPDTVERTLTISGPGDAVEAALDAARFVPFGNSAIAHDAFIIQVTDFGNSGEGDAGTTNYQKFFAVYPHGIMDLGRGEHERLSSGSIYVPENSYAEFRVHDAYEIRFVLLDLPINEGGCGIWLRIYDGTDTATGQLLSTNLFPTGELCGRDILPTFTGLTGEFVVTFDVPVFLELDGFDTDVLATPEGFQAWVLDGGNVEAVGGGGAIQLPQIMITSLPDPTDISVTISAEEGSVRVRFAESFVDILDVTAPSSTVSIAHSTAAVPVMLRVGTVLTELLYVPGPDFVGTDTVVVQASSDGVDAPPLEIPIAISAAAINAPASFLTNAFRPVRLPVSVAVAAAEAAAVAVTVSSSAGIGQLSLDHRAALWIDVGLSDSVTASGTLAEVNALLGDLTYKANLGGADALVVTMGDQTRTINVLVDPECSGEHTIYGREGSITERAGPATDRYSSDTICRFDIYGARLLSFPFFDINFFSYLSISADGRQVYGSAFAPPPTLQVSTTGFFSVFFEASEATGQGWVAAFQRQDGVNDPPLVVVPTDPLFVVRGSTTRLRGLYIDDFTEGTITASLETDAGSLQTPGTRLIETTAATFDELDAWVTSIEFLAGDAQTTANLRLTATDSDDASASAVFAVEILSCSGLAEVALEGAGVSSSVTISDGSGFGDYPPGLSCQWRLTGAPAPAVLDVEFLDMDCNGDSVTVYDGSSAAGRELGTFCKADELATVGELVSSTGSFFLSVLTNDDGLADDGFSFVYRGLEAGVETGLGRAPADQDPERTDSTVMALPGSEAVVVFGGWTGVRPVAQPLLYTVGAGWQALAGSGPPARFRAAGVAVDAAQFVVHGGIDAAGQVLSDTWLGDVDLDTGAIAWTPVLSNQVLATADGKMLLHAGAVFLVDATGVWELGDGWVRIGSTPPAVVATSGAYSADAGTLYATGADGALWALGLVSLAWRTLDGVAFSGPCTAWACTGAMLGVDEYAVVLDDGRTERTNVTAAEPVVDELDPGLAGAAIGATYLGQPAMYLFGSGTLSVVALTLGVGEIAPLIAPTRGGTVLQVAGEQLSACPRPQCAFGQSLSTATVTSERTAECVVSPRGAGAAEVWLSCESGAAQYPASTGLLYFDDPVVTATPADPEPGETITIAIGGVSDEVLALAADPLCLFGEVTRVSAQLDGAQMLCQVPEDEVPGTSTFVQVSLDGQSYSENRADIQVSSGASKSESPVALIAAVVGAAAVLMVAVFVRYRWLVKHRVANGPAPWEIKFEAIELFDVIGSGGYGAVYRGRYRGGEVAVKVTKGDAITPEMIDAFRKESALMAELRHPNIVLFMGACTEPPNIAIVLEFLSHGSLFDLIHDDRIVLRGAERQAFALDIAKGMAYLHAADPPIIHRDLKSLNVLVDKNWTMKVSDFGLTELFQGDDKGKGRGWGGAENRRDDDVTSMSSGSTAEVANVQGSVQWMAPEVLRGAVADKASDVYSFAVTLWEICVRDVPFESLNLPIAAISMSLVVDPNFRPRSDVEIPAPYATIIQECWDPDPTRRPTFADLVERLEHRGTDVEMDSANMTDSVFGSMHSPAEIPSGKGCAAVVRVDGANAQWARNPAGMRSMIRTVQETVDRLCSEARGTALPPDDSGTLCVFGEIETGLKFAVDLQTVLLASDWVGEAPATGAELFRGLRVAVGVDAGRVERLTDQATHATYYEGGAVRSATKLAWTGVGGQVVAPRGVVEQVDASSLGISAIDLEDHRGPVALAAVYPEALRQRHALIMMDGGAAGDPEGKPDWMIEPSELELGDLIGAGSLGTVFKGVWRGASVAAKQLHRKKLGKNETLDLQMESGMASKLRHPNVCQFLGVCRNPDNGKVFVVSEYMTKGSVFDAIVTARRKIAVKIKIKVARELALGLRYLHEQDPVVVHRSLTSRNVLLGKDWSVKVSDFGLARVKAGAATMTKVGSSAYSAPELLRGARYDEKADVFAFAVVLWEIAAQRVAWAGVRMGRVARDVLDGQRPPIGEPMRNTIGAGYVGVVERCWAADPSERPQIRDCEGGLVESSGGD